MFTAHYIAEVAKVYLLCIVAGQHHLNITPQLDGMDGAGAEPAAGRRREASVCGFELNDGQTDSSSYVRLADCPFKRSVGYLRLWELFALISIWVSLLIYM
jgi:hypothetical protein